MKGLTVKEFLRKRGWKVAQVADIMGESKQNLSGMLAKDDVKTGLVERISVATGIPVVEFYGGEPSQTAIASGENSIAAVNSKVGKDAQVELIQLRAENELLRGQLEWAQGMIEKLTKK